MPRSTAAAAFVAALPGYTAWLEESRPLAPGMTEAYSPLRIANQMVDEGRSPAEVIAYLEKRALVAWGQITALEELFEGTI
jgi:hypothetical protein